VASDSVNDFDVSLFFYLHSFATSNSIKNPAGIFQKAVFLENVSNTEPSTLLPFLMDQTPGKFTLKDLFLMESPAAQLHAPKLEISFYSICT